jgi:hypothetical protein
MNDEIERLREMRADWRAAMTENNYLWCENERLRALIDRVLVALTREKEIPNGE